VFLSCDLSRVDDVLRKRMGSLPQTGTETEYVRVIVFVFSIESLFPDNIEPSCFFFVLVFFLVFFFFFLSFFFFFFLVPCLASPDIWEFFSDFSSQVVPTVFFSCPFSL